MALVGSAIVALGVALFFLIRSHNDSKDGTSSKSRSVERSSSPMRPSLGQNPNSEPEGVLRLDGRVIGPDGQPIDGAEVWISSVPRKSTRTSADGAFAFDGLNGRSYDVAAKTAELVGGPQPVRVSLRTAPIVIRLSEGAHVQVTVVDDANAPIAGAAVLIPADGTVTNTDAKGEARMSVTPGWVEIEATAAELAPRRVTTIIGSAGATARITLALGKGFPVTGRVVDEQGTGIPGARVSARQTGTREDLTESAMTGGDGAFTLAALVGSYSLLATDEEHAPGNTPDLEVDRALDGIKITMKAGAVYAGTVVDAHAVPVPHARVHLDRNIVERRETTADANGAFEIRGLPRSPYWLSYAESDVGVSEEARIDLTSDVRDEKLVLELAVDANNVVSGVVVDDAGAVVANVAVNARLRMRQASVMSSATADGEGAFSIPNLPRGDYSVWVGRPDEQLPDDRVTIAKAGDSGVRVVFTRTGGIKGRVVLAEASAPPAWFAVELASPETGGSGPTPGHDGAFEIREVRAGTFTLRVTGTEFANATKAKVQIEPGKTTDVGTIVVDRGRAISGKVVDSAGQPVAGARVAVGYGVQGTGGFDDRLVGGRSTLSDQSGSFTLVGLDEKLNFGPVPLVIAAIHPVRGRSLPVGIPEGVEHPPDVTLQLRASGSISGRVTQAGKPIANAMVGAGWPELGMATTTDDGDFIISRLPEGVVVLRTMLPTGMLQPFSTTVNVVGGKQVEANIDVPIGTLTLVVNVKPRAGEDVPTAKLFLFSGTVAIETYKQVAPQLWQSSQGFGQWRGTGSPPQKFGKLIPGDYTVCALPLSGDSNAPGFMERLREHGDAVKVYCTPTKVASAPDEQSITIEVPPMQPLPPK